MPLKDIALAIFGKVHLITTPQSRNMTLEYEAAGQLDCVIMYLSDPLLPVTVRISGGATGFPFANGLTIAAMGRFATDEAVAEATLYDPGLMEIDWVVRGGVGDAFVG